VIFEAETAQQMPHPVIAFDVISDYNIIFAAVSGYLYCFPDGLFAETSALIILIYHHSPYHEFPFCFVYINEYETDDFSICHNCIGKDIIFMSIEIAFRQRSDVWGNEFLPLLIVINFQ